MGCCLNFDHKKIIYVCFSDRDVSKFKNEHHLMPPWIWSSAKYYEIFYIQAVKGMNLQYYIAIVKAKKPTVDRFQIPWLYFLYF